MASKPHELRSVTVSTWEPVQDTLDSIRDPLTGLLLELDALGKAVLLEAPAARDFRRALEAFDRLPELAVEVERALAPKRVETLMRRIARLRGVSAKDFARREGWRRFVR